MQSISFQESLNPRYRPTKEDRGVEGAWFTSVLEMVFGGDSDTFEDSVFSSARVSALYQRLTTRYYTK